MMLFTTLLLSAFAAGQHLPEPPNCSEEELMNGYNYTLRGGWMDLSMYITWARRLHPHILITSINFTSAAGICTEKSLANAASGNGSLFCISTPLHVFSQCLRVKKSIPLNVTNVLSSCHDFESIGTDVLKEAKFPFESRFCHKSLHGDLTRVLLVATRQGAERWIVETCHWMKAKMCHNPEMMILREFVPGSGWFRLSCRGWRAVCPWTWHWRAPSLSFATGWEVSSFTLTT